MTLIVTDITTLMITPLLMMASFTFKYDFTKESAYHGDSLYDSIVMMDSRWEDAYNNCKLDVMEEVISEDIEFYHDQAGYSTSKPQLLTAVRENICGKVTRMLKPESIEVHEIPGYGAVQMGLHGFRNAAEPNAPVHYSKFIHIWKRVHGKWQMTRVISLH